MLNLAVNVSEVLRLESSWREFLPEKVAKDVPKNEARFQEAIWEIFFTEHNYMNGDFFPLTQVFYTGKLNRACF